MPLQGGTTIGSKGSGNGQFNCPSSVIVDGSGNMFVRDDGRIQVFRVNDGAHVRAICSKGSGPGQLGCNWGGVAFDG